MNGNGKTWIWIMAGVFALGAAASWNASGVGTSIHFDSDGGDYSKVHGSVNVPAGAKAGTVKTVNGSVTIGDGAEVDRVKVVNGSIKIGETAVVHSEVSSVNGSVQLRRNARAESDVTTVNGRMSLDRGAVVAGEVRTVNGRMELDGAEAGSLKTTNGDIELRDGAVVLGDLVVEKPQNKGWNLFGSHDRPRVVIGENCEVRGKLHFEQEVELEVADSATIGEITGVQPIRD